MSLPLNPVPNRPVVLCILDGWGVRERTEYNAIAMAHTPNWDRLWDSCPKSQLDASEMSVGLPKGQMGNSEVGHMNIGTGRIVLQDLPRIDRAIESGELAANVELVAFIEKLKKSGGACHLMGLLSPGGVHSHQRHIAYLARIVADAGIKVWIHAFLDGRDTPPSSAFGYIDKFYDEIQEHPRIQFATVSGRYYAMDRDKRWERVEKVYNAMTLDRGDWVAAAETPLGTMGVTDEFIPPCVVGEFEQMQDGDALLMANFRADRAREILTALLDPDFDGFKRKRTVQFSAALGMVEYSTVLNPFLQTLFPPENLQNTLGDVMAANGLKQLRIAETEKYAHVTFFFNGGVEEPLEGEDRILVSSPDVATYDLQPEMSAPEVTDKLVEAVQSGKYDLIVVNYANPDMVGHTGNMDAAVQAAGAVDQCLGRLAVAVEKAGGILLVTADHGNAELMYDAEKGTAHTAHTLNKVPFMICGGNVAALREGRLSDIAPTILDLMHITKPDDMSGHSLLG